MRPARGFTLIELTIALAILVVVSGLVIVRMGGWGPRQRVITAARTIGNTLSYYREVARNEERTYAMVLETNAKRISVYAPLERQISALNSAALIRSIDLPSGIEVQYQSQTTNDPPIIFLDSKGIVPNFQINVQQGGEHVLIKTDPIVNRISYE